MNWGKSIVLVFVLFAGFIGTMVVRMSRQTIDLVRDDYYQDEMAYQQQIDRVSNARELDPATYIQYQDGSQQVKLRLPDSLQRGTLTLYCPADRKQDIRLPLTASTQVITAISMQKRQRGLWRAQLAWFDGKREYYTERELILP
ncbi:FixH family protein [Spirosoma fluviale]|uniref:FixH protein n=1 Tax=Spirosoma fluviale TaxID=1597977 RepID=A0A286GE06_9BACT|nr:FixH family protein [Spirosoma fluviale]SOD93369.1 hypothetical protein SAMN06269250_4473 [Spirosoma fluviale]